MSTSVFQDHRAEGSAAPSLPALIAAMRVDEPRFTALGILLLAAILPTGLAALIDTRSLEGIELWEKPLKFEIALVVYLLTLAFFARYVPRAVANARWYRIYSGAVVTAVVVEMAWIGGAAWLGTLSHFNASPVGAVIYPLMGAAAVLLTSATAVQAVLIARNPSSGLEPALKDAIVLGLALTLPLTLLTAGTMAQMATHFVGGAGAVRATFPFMGWALDRGDLRVSHFFATHAMHAIPLVGLLTSAGLRVRSRVPVAIAAMLYAALVVVLFVGGLAGKPVLPL